MPLFVVSFEIVGQPSAEELAAQGAAIRTAFAAGELRQLCHAEDFSVGWAYWRIDSAEDLWQRVEALPVRQYLANITITKMAEPTLAGDLCG